MAIAFSSSPDVEAVHLRSRDFMHEIHQMRIAQTLMQAYSESGSVRRATRDLPR